MKSRYIRLIFLPAAILCIITLFVIYNWNEKHIYGNARVIAIVNGKNIYGEDTNKITKMIDIMNLNQLSNEQLSQAVQKHEVNNLFSAVRQTILEQKYIEYGITASEGEVLDKINETFAKIDNDTALKIIEKSKATFDALEQWQKEPSESDAIYNKKLAPLDIKKDQWELAKQIYDTPEKLKQMQVPKNIEEMKMLSYESAKNDLLYEKLMDTVTSDNAKTEEEKTAAQQTWWNEQYKNAKIVILDPKYDEVMDLLHRGRK